MAVKVQMSSDGAIEFYEKGVLFYDLSKGEIGRHGTAYWENHLAGKQWVTPEVLSEFRRIATRVQ